MSMYIYIYIYHTKCQQCVNDCQYIYIYIIMSMCYPNDNVSRYPKSRSFHAS